jgi:hypothetical protein
LDSLILKILYEDILFACVRRGAKHSDLLLASVVHLNAKEGKMHVGRTAQGISERIRQGKGLGWVLLRYHKAGAY